MYKKPVNNTYRDSLCSVFILGVSLGELDDHRTDLFLDVGLIHKALLQYDQ